VALVTAYKLTDTQRDLFDKCVLAAVQAGLMTIPDIVEAARLRMLKVDDLAVRSAARNHAVEKHVRNALVRLRTNGLIRSGERVGRAKTWLPALN
jgi:hypothetical protein